MKKEHERIDPTLIKSVDIVVGLSWGDESKGKVVSQLSSKRFGKFTPYYNSVCRWAGGNNAGHTVYVDGKKYKTHLVPSGVFHGVQSVIGPGCVLHIESFLDEIKYLKANGFNADYLVKVSPRCHIITDQHIEEDKRNLAEKLGTTSRGIAPCYAAKAARTGIQAKDVMDPKYLWDERLTGNVLCEGAQGVWLDINHGNYPYVTSSETLPYAACSLGFPPQKIEHIYGAAKIYDTRSGEDPLFPSSLLEDPILAKIATLGEEFGVTTGRPRKVNWLNLDKLIQSINLTGVTDLIISKCDILEKLGIYRLFHYNELMYFDSLNEMIEYIEFDVLSTECPLLKRVTFSYSPESFYE